MSTRKFQELTVKMSPAQKQRVRERAEELRKELKAAETYFLETGKDFYALGPVEQRRLLEGR